MKPRQKSLYCSSKFFRRSLRMKFNNYQYFVCEFNILWKTVQVNNFFQTKLPRVFLLILHTCWHSLAINFLEDSENNWCTKLLFVERTFFLNILFTDYIIHTDPRAHSCFELREFSESNLNDEQCTRRSNQILQRLLSIQYHSEFGLFHANSSCLNVN